MVQITASLLALLAAVSLTHAVPSTLVARKPDCSSGTRTNPGDAARCIRELAALGSVCTTDYGGRILRICGTAMIWSHSRGPKGASTPCKNVAASAGLIMDACTYNTGPSAGIQVAGAAYVQGNGDFWIRIEHS
ncbi:uncharacterized protein K460DRAFT_354725 [Cucurbitaria berberidis CBS 394.84]|uniref:Cyanovirin-N domain-containing protein n=1 Tax=Cucurbitaria berberidis CBS 394.84 TaxID=1168544 RepID=A0A9P4GGJ6_9PLEO|nr:uncharacterized protein K460DRAFT_354725 [Cucurbitaria berberidis CBS 394.84]KAF1844856.1 hypothetical protein K460DRAFT_354725 [Cucurbitaria berberidis CBS 394.84]